MPTFGMCASLEPTYLVSAYILGILGPGLWNKVCCTLIEQALPLTSTSELKGGIRANFEITYLVSAYSFRIVK